MATADILSRTSGDVITQVADGTQTHSLTEPSVVRVNGSRTLVARYERVGNDLILHMQDGSTVTYRSFFLTNAEGLHSELVFDDGIGVLDHAVFAEGVATAAPTAVVPTFAALDTIGPLIATGSAFALSPLALAGIGAVALGGGIALAAGGGGGGGGSAGDAGGGGVTPGAAPVVTLTPFAADNLLNAGEAQAAQTLTGTVQNAEAGSSVLLTLNGVTYTGVVAADGSFSISVPASALQGLADGSYPLNVTVTNAAGLSGQATLTVGVDTTAPAVTVNAVAGDNLIDAAEATQPLVISGSATAADAGQTVTVTLNGTTYTGVVNADGSWSVTLPAGALSGLANGTYLLTTSLTDAAGNTTSVTQSVVLNTTGAALPTLTLAPVTGDNVIDSTEVQSAQTLSGTTTGVEAGQTVTLVLNGITYTAAVNADGSWSTTVPAADLALLASGNTTLTATVSNQAGVQAADSETLTVNLGAAQPTLTLAAFAGDNVLDSTEAQAAQTLSGTTTGVEAGQTVTLVLNGITYTAAVNADGSWSTTVPAADLALLAAGSLPLTATVSTVAGVTAGANATLVVAGAPTINPVATDNIINAADAAADLVLSGTTGAPGAGQGVTVTVGGTVYTGSVDAAGNWSVTVPAATLQALPQGTTTLNIAVTSASGNVTPLTATVTNDTVAPALVVDPVAGDQTINITDAQSDIIVSGTTSDPAAPLSVTLNGVSYTPVVAADGSWTATIPANTLTYPAGSYPLVVTTTDAAGNPASVTQNLYLHADPAAAPTVSVNPFAGDNTVDGAELNVAQVLSGTTTNMEAGQILTLQIGPGLQRTAQVQADGSWQLTLTAAELGELPAGTTTLTVQATDAAGNPVTATSSIGIIPTQGGVAIAAVTGDNLINAAEAAAGVTLQGSTQNVDEGATVQVTLNGITYTTTTQADGSWSLEVPAADLQALADGSYPVTATTTDSGGTVVTSTTTVTTVITTLPVVTVNPPLGDGVLNLAEAAADQTLTGSTGVAGAGQTVTLTLGDTAYNAVVAADGSWSLVVPAADLQALPSGSVPYSVLATDAAGNSTTLTGSLPVDFGAPTLTLNPIAGDGTLNAAEQQVSQILSGTAFGVEAGQTVTVTLNGITYSAPVLSGGNWEVTIPAADLALLANGGLTLTATVADAAGNSVSQSQTLIVNNTVGGLAVDPIAGDNRINAAEATAPLVLTGSAANVAEGSPVTVTLNNVTYTGTVGADGSWTVTVPVADVAALPDGTNTLTLSATDAGGTPLSSSVALDTRITTLPEPVADTPFGDGTLSGPEAAVDQTLTGNTGVTGAGQAVVVNLNGVDYPATVQADGSWSATVPAADLQAIPAGTTTLTVTATDPAGNTDSSTTPLTVLGSSNLITIDPVTGDNLVNADEAAGGITLSGTADSLAAGSTLTLTLAGQTYTTTTGTDGSWSVEVPEADVLAWTGNPLTLVVTAPDGTSSSVEIGNYVTNPAAPTFDTPFGNNVLNIEEAAVDQVLTGTTGITGAGQTVSVTLGDTAYPGSVDADGNWTVILPSAVLQALEDGSTPLQVTVTDIAGNSATATQTPAVALTAPTLTVGTVADDNVINYAEAQAGVAVSGTASLPDSTVTVTLGGQTFTAQTNGDGDWTLSLPAGALSAGGAFPDGTYPLTVSVTDANGNTTTTSQDVVINADEDSLPTVTLDAVSGDNQLSEAEHQVSQTLSGTTTNVEAGQTVTLTLNDQTYTATVQGDGTFSVIVPAADVAALPGGASTVVATVSDSAGNTAPAAEQGITVEDALGGIAIDTVATDNRINAAEAASDLVVQGTAFNVADNTPVTFSFAGRSFFARVASGSWRVTIPAEVVQAVGSGTVVATATTTQADGTTATNELPISLYVSPVPVATLDTPFGDGFLNAQDITTPQTLTGRTGVTGAGQTITLTLADIPLTGTVDNDGVWRVTVPVDVLQQLAEGNAPIAVQVQVADAGGNTSSTTGNAVVDLTAPAVTIDALAGNDILNAAEQGVPLVISGTATGGVEGQSVTVTLNGVTYTTTVQASGNWQLTVPAADLAALGNGGLTVSATVNDLAGNPGTADRVLIVNTALGGIAIDTLAGDNALSAAEAGQPLVVSGTTANVTPGSVVSVELAGTTYTGTVNSDGSWTVTVPAAAVGALPDGLNSVTATVTDAGGTGETATVTLDVHITNLPQATLDTPATLNGSDAQAELALTGSTGVSGDGQSVTLTLNGQTFTGLVDGDGGWQVTLPAAALQALTDGTYPLTVTVTDAAGNTSTATGSLPVDVTAPTLAIDPVTGDNVLNQADVQAGIAVTGQSDDLDGTVTVTFNDQTFTATVGSDGSWSVTLPAAALEGLDGSFPLTATLTDAAGNPATFTQTVTVDATDLPQLTLDPFAGDNELDSAERGVAQTLSGTTTNVEAGQTVTVTLNNTTYTTTVLADGTWSLLVPAADLALLTTGPATLTATVADIAGNSITADETVTVVTGQEGVAIDTLSGDNFLNAAEVGEPLAVSGVVVGVPEGNTVTVTLNGETYTATVNADATWRLEIPADDLAGLADGTYSVTAEAVDSNGATVNAALDLVVLINNLPQPQANAPFGDGYLSISEAAAGQVLSGQTGISGTGQTVTVTLAGQNITATVDENGFWSAAVPADLLQSLSNGLVNFNVNASDAAGNSADTTGAFTVDFTAPGLSISPLTADNIVNITEAAGEVTLRGTSADIPLNGAAGATVTVTLNGETYTTTVTEEGTWSVPLPVGALAGLPDGSYPVTASITDDAGNSTSVTGSVTLATDPANEPQITFNAFAGDNTLNGAEQNTTQLLSGTVANVEAGQVVTLTLNGRTYTATVQPDNSWSTTVPANDLRLLSNGTVTISASVENVAGNSGTAENTVTVNLDQGGISLNPLAGDNLLNAQEAANDLVISGTTLNVPAGTTITVAFNGETYTTQASEQGVWSVTVPSAALALLTDGTQTVTVTSTDGGGNPVTTSTSLSVFVNNLPVPTLDLPFLDGVLNTAEAQLPQTLTGSTGIAGAGQSVSLTLGGTLYTGTVDANGNWSLTLPAQALSDLPDGTATLPITVSDLAGNTATLNGSAQIDFTAPTVVVNPIANDNIANAAEIAAGVVVSGSGSEVGDIVTVTILFNGIAYEATVQPGGGWSLTLPPSALANLPDGNYDLLISLTDAAGNTSDLIQTLVLDGAAENLPVLTINPIAGDDILNGAEIQSAQLISGVAQNVESGQNVQVTLGDNTYIAQVQAGGVWSVSIPAADLALLADGAQTLSAGVADAAGNLTTASRPITLNTAQGGLSIDPVTGDNLINAAEAGAAITLSGNSANVAEGATVTLTLNGITYTAAVGADGSWSTTVPADDAALLTDGSLLLSAGVTDNGGTEQTANVTLGVFVTPVPAPTVNDLFADGVLSSSEAAQSLGQSIAGNTGITGNGQTVVVTLAGQTINAVVDSTGAWSATLPPALLTGLADGSNSLTVTTTDAAGNTNQTQSTFQADFTPPALTLDPIAGDNILINSDVNTTITGTSSATGQTVVVTLFGVPYQAEVLEDGSWSLFLSGLNQAPNGTYPVTVSVTDAAGNVTTLTDELQVARNLDIAITRDTFTGDDVLNAAEVLVDQVISGSTVGVEAGQTLTVRFNGTDYTTTVTSGGGWSLLLPQSALAGLANGEQVVIETRVSDVYGNPAVQSSSITVNLDQGGIAFNPVTGDNYINAQEATADVVLSGTTANVAEGAPLALTFDGLSYTTTVGAGGSWSITLPAADVATLPDGDVPLTATVTDLGGTEITQTLDIGVHITTLPAPVLNTPLGDGFLSAAAAGQDQYLSGATGISGDGQTVLVTLGNFTYNAQVNNDGSWTATLPAADLQTLPEGSTPIVVAASDIAGNTVTTTSALTVDFTAPALTVADVATDNALNAAEVQQPFSLSGTAPAGEAGQTVTATLNSVSYTTAVLADGTWSLSIPAGALAGQPDGSYPLTVTLTDAAGNTSTSTSALTLAATLPLPQVDTPLQNSYLNAAEAATPQTFTGNSGVAGSGQSVVVNIAGADYPATVDADGNWSLTLQPAVLQALTPGTQPVVVTVTDAFGNQGVAQSALIVDYAAPALTVSPVAGDNTLNAAELAGTVLFTGTTDAAETGQTVTLDFNNQVYQTQVQEDGSWSITLPDGVSQTLADGSYPVTVSLLDAAGNTAVQTFPLVVAASATALPTLTVLAVSGDNYINQAEAAADVTVTGSSTNLPAGQVVTLTLADQTFTGTVAADGTWSVVVPSAAVAALGDGTQSFTVSAADVAGNPANNIGQFTLVAQAASLPAVSIDPVSNDGVINAQEVQNDLTLTGSSQNVPEGSTLTIALSGVLTYTATVNADGSWSVLVPSADLGTLPQGANSITVTGSDVAGNPATGSETFTVDTDLPLLNVTTSLGTDATLNQAEALAGLVVSGTAEAGLPVNATLNGVTYTVVAATDGSYSLTIPAGDLQQLPDGATTLDITITDASGNLSAQSLPVTVAINTLPALTLNTPFGDGLVSAAEAAADQVLSGTTTNLAAGTPVTVTLGSLTFAAVVNADNTWSVTIPANTLTPLGDGAEQILVSAADVAGNPASASASAELVIAAVPVAAITTPFVTGQLNAVTAATDQVISGSTGVTGSGQTVTLTLDGEPVPVTVEENGLWSATLTSAQLTGLSDGTHTLDVTVTDRAGNTSSTATPFTAIVNTLPDVTFNLPFGDGIINAAEAAQGGALSGNTGITGTQTVVVNVNGTLYPADVDPATGNWSLTLSPALLTSLPDGAWPGAVTVTDAVGNTSTLGGDLIIAINNLPTATLNAPFGDAQLNIAEAAAGQTLSGKTGLTGDGQTVTVAIDGGTPFTATVTPNGDWTLDLTPAQLQGLANGPHTLLVTATDFAGNSSTTSLGFVASLIPLDPVIDTPFTDGVLNIAEAAGPLTITGNTGEVGVGQGAQLTLDLAGISYPGTVDAQGNWSVTLPAGALSGLQTGQHELDVTLVDQAGNTTTEVLAFTAALTAPVPTFAVASGEGVINAAAVAGGIVMSGTTGATGAGQTAIVTLGGTPYTATVAEDGSWTLPLSSAQLGALAQGDQPLILTVTDSAGNTATLNDSVRVDTTVPAIDTLVFSAGDTLDYVESFTTQTLSGTATNAEAGDTITVTIGDGTQSGIVNADGSWSVNLTPALLEGLDEAGAIGVSITDLAGNTSSTSLPVAVDLTPPAAPDVAVGALGGDNIINAADAQTLFLTGRFFRLATGSAGTVTVTRADGTVLGTTPISGTDGEWSVGIANTAANLPDGTQTLTVTLATATTTLTSTATVLVDRTAPTLTLDPFTGDNTLSAGEQASSQILSGTVSAADAGQTVTLTLNDNTFRAVVQADGTWSTTVPSSALQALTDGDYPITATVTDAAGNVTTQTQTLTVDTAAPLITVAALADDNILNAADILTTQVLTGTASGAEGQTIGLYLGDGSPIATAVVSETGTFSLDLTPEVLGSLAEGALVFGLRVGDQAGNTTAATVTVNKVVNSALNLVVDSVFGDNTLNALDTAVAQTISGVATSAGIGATVAVTLGGTTLTADVGQNGQFAIVVPPDVLGLLSDGNLALDITLTDAAGNTRTVSETVTAIVDNVPVVGELTGLFGGDNLLNVAETLAGQTLSGVVDAAEGSTVTVTLGTRAYQSLVGANGSWSVTLPSADLSALAVGDLALNLSVVDPAGNIATGSATIGVFNTQPTITLNPIFGNGLLNIAGALVDQTISGVATNAAPGSTVTLAIGNRTVEATVGTNGSFSAVVTPDILSTLTSGPLTVGATLNGLSGNTATTTGSLTVDVTAPTITLNPLFGDALLNAADATVSQLIGGTIANAEAGSRVVVSVGNQQYVTTTAADGTFSLSLAPAILRTLTDGNLSVGVSVTDAAGNTSSTSGTALVGITNLPTINLNPVFGGDNILNVLEALTTQTISGNVGNVAAGSTVRINVGNIVTTATVGQNGNFSAQLTPDVLGTLLSGNLTVGVSVTDPVGNVARASVGAVVGPRVTPTVTLNTIFGDGVLSAADLTTAQTISGSTTNAATGSAISVALGGSTYTTTVGSNGAWSLSVPASSLTGLANGTQTVNVTVTDPYGATGTASRTVSVIAQTPPTVTLSSVFGDNAISAADARQAQTISGTTTNAEGSTLRVTLGGTTYTTTVGSSGAWSVSVPAAALAALADGSYTLTASVTNAANNTGSNTAPVTVLTHTQPTITLGSVFGGDGYLNLNEANSGQTISGTSTNAVGSTVSVNVAGNVLTTTVGSNGAWSVTVPSGTLRNINDGSQTLTVSVSDAGGNTANASTTFTAITRNVPQVGVDPVLNLVNYLLFGLTISGGTRNLAQGSRVKVTLQGVSQNATVDAFGRYSVHYSSSLLGGLLINLNSIVTVSAVDVAGNTASTTTTLLLGSLLPVAATAEAQTLMMAVATDDASAQAAGDDNNSDGTVTTLSALSVGSEAAATSDSADSTPATATADTTTAAAVTEEGGETAYSIGGLTLDLSTSGGEALGGTGNDTIQLHTLDFLHIDGGDGIDTLQLAGTGQHLDLVALGLKVEHIEIFDLGQSGTNSLTLDLHEAETVKDQPDETLFIRGAEGSQVTLVGDGATWATTGQRVVDGLTFDVYHNSSLESSNTLGDVLVQHGIQVQQV
ncbi:Ig-like domain-containing protein [Chimaeribacter arupi]|uniref:Ig-like domain-containing protein n=1 Tax=Chimaeribacter arupi TaxID=2060066 RepID=UPI000C7C08B9|nr:Ig-like domain-containing protein [Chimaeribacter arupi]PLR38985.1 hemagglutinin [Chimaeribacter arupi]